MSAGGGGGGSSGGAGVDDTDEASLAVGRPCATEVDTSMKPSNEKVGAGEEGVPAVGGFSESRGLRSPQGRPVARELSGVETRESVPAVVRTWYEGGDG